MKRVIDGKMYNTETAEEVSSWSNGLGRSDFKCLEETLYLSKKGNWFLEYFGGAATSYAETYSNMSSEGSGIKVLSKEDALRWLEKHGKTNAIEKYFKDEIEEA